MDGNVQVLLVTELALRYSMSIGGGVAFPQDACGGGASGLLSNVSIADLLTGQKLGRVHWPTFLPSIGGVKLY